MPEEEVIEADFAEVGKVVEADDPRPFERLDLEDVMSVRLRLTAELGKEFRTSVSEPIGEFLTRINVLVNASSARISTAR